ncbi:MAG: polysaccharide biosynthesis/export family protein, partial [Syntrophobacterales bacterium]
MRVSTIPMMLTMGFSLLLAFSAPKGAQVMDSPKVDYVIIMQLIERWEAEVERRGLEYYLSRYGDSSQEAGDIKRKKGNSGGVDITIEDVRVFGRDDGVITTTFLRRANSRNFQDVGVGVLSFKRENGRWKVDGEEWYPISADALAEGKAYTVTIGPGNAPRITIHSTVKRRQNRGKISEKKVRTPEKKVPTPEKRVAVRKEVSGNHDPGEYTIGAGDVLLINVWGHGDLSREVVVSEKGTFSFPLIGGVEAAGLTVKELEANLVRLLSAGYLVNPYVTVRVKGYKSK